MLPPHPPQPTFPRPWRGPQRGHPSAGRGSSGNSVLGARRDPPVSPQPHPIQPLIKLSLNKREVLVTPGAFRGRYFKILLMGLRNVYLICKEFGISPFICYFIGFSDKCLFSALALICLVFFSFAQIIFYICFSFTSQTS